MLENAEVAIKMDNPEKLATRRRITKQKHNTRCIGHHYSSNGCKTIHTCTNYQMSKIEQTIQVSTGHLN